MIVTDSTGQTYQNTDFLRTKGGFKVANGRMTITEIAKILGVTPKTITRWEKTGKVRKSRRDWRGWRVYEKDDLVNIKEFFESLYDYE